MACGGMEMVECALADGNPSIHNSPLLPPHNLKHARARQARRLGTLFSPVPKSHIEHSKQLEHAYLLVLTYYYHILYLGAKLSG